MTHRISLFSSALFALLCVSCTEPPQTAKPFELPPWTWPASHIAFVDGGKPSGVPAELLAALAAVAAGETGEHASGCMSPKRVGVMGLLPSGAGGATFTAAAEAAGLAEDAVKSNEDANIQAAAAWLRKVAGPTARASHPADWVAAIQQWSGSAGPAAQLFTAEVYAQMKVIRAATKGLDTGDEGEIDLDMLDIQAATQPSPDQPGASYLPACSTNFTAKWRNKAAIDRVVIHTVQGSYVGAIGWFANCSSKVSAHYTVSKQGEITQSVRDRDVAWHAGHWLTNQRSIGIEHEGFVDNAATWTNAMLAASAKLTASICLRYDIPVDRAHIIGHHEVPGCKNSKGGGAGCHTDPQPHFPWTKYIALVKTAAGKVNESPAKPKPAPNLPAAGQSSDTDDFGKTSTCKPMPVTGAKGPEFDDVPTTAFSYKYVRAIHTKIGVKGCSTAPPLFCPWCTLSRATLTTWIAKAMGLAPQKPNVPSFSDVPKSAAQWPWLEAAAKAGIIAGCGGSKFCPNAAMTRRQVAIVVAKAAKLPVKPAKGLFTDVPKSDPHASLVESLTPACIAIGCSANKFCPEVAVTRAEAAFIVSRAFDLNDVNPCLSNNGSQPAGPTKPVAPTHSKPELTWLAPMPGSAVKNPILFKFTAKHVDKVRLLLNGWAISPWLPASAQTWLHKAVQSGKVTVQLVAIDKQKNVVAKRSTSFVVQTPPSVTIVHPSGGNTLGSEVLFEVQSKGATTLELRRNGKVLKKWAAAKGPMATVYFNDNGPKWVEAIARDGAGKELAKDGVMFQVDTKKDEPPPQGPGTPQLADITIVSPKKGATVSNPVTFVLTAKAVAQVALYADDWPLTTPFSPLVKTQHTYKFHSVGKRLIKAVGFNNAGQVVASHTLDIWVKNTTLKPAPTGEWGHILPIDNGVRSDSAGAGHFGASRYGNSGGHSGIDFLAPKGTALLAPCAGDVIAGSAYGYGKYVQLACPMPQSLGGATGLWASVFFAHLDSHAVSHGAKVKKGVKLGTVGKTGNASGSAVMPHAHFEIAIHGSKSAALNELHGSSNHSGTAAAKKAKALIEKSCFQPTGFKAKTGPTFKGRRIDPFMLLSCATAGRPHYKKPGGSLGNYSQAWSKHFSATTFDVNQGQ